MKATVICVLSTIFGLTSLSARASDPPPSAQTAVDNELIKPLARREGRQSRFSRVVIPARTRTARILEGAHRDTRGSEFFRFSIDERRGMQQVLFKDALTGCVYPQSGDV